MSFRTEAHSELDSAAIDTEIEPQKLLVVHTVQK
jgi:hypothetical protein